MHITKTFIISLFNSGKLDLDAATWYQNRGYAFICGDGRLVDIVKEGGCGHI